MKQTPIFKTYNQITKLFDVMIMTKQQINKLDTNQGFLVVTPKKHIDVVRPPRRTRKTKQPTLREMIAGISTRLDSIENRLTSIVQANNLVDPTLKK